MFGRLLRYLAAAVAGAGLMYLLDPAGGRRRRARVRDQVVSAVHRTGAAVDSTSRDVRNRAHHVVAELRGRLRSREVSDEVLDARVRSRVGSIVGRAGGILTHVMDGRVTLRGPVLAEEVDRLMRRVSAVPGVKDVVNELVVHERPGNIPALQGRPRPPRGGEVFELLQTRWSPTARLLVGAAGSLLALWGLRRLDGLSGVLALAGAGLLGTAGVSASLPRFERRLRRRNPGLGRASDGTAEG